MDFIKKYFDLAQTVLVDFALSWLFTLWMTLRHPILGPQFLARRQALGDRRAMPPLLFFFTTTLFYVLLFGAAVEDRVLLAQGLLEGRTGAQANIHLTTALLLSALIVLAFWAYRTLLRALAARRMRRAGLRRKGLPAEAPLLAARYRALPYATVFAFVGLNLGVAIFFSTPSIYDWIERTGTRLLGLLSSSGLMAAGPWGGGVVLATVIAFPAVILAFFAFLAPPFWPLMRLLATPTALTRPPKMRVWRLQMAGWTILAAAVFMGFLMATFSVANGLHALRNGRGVMLSGVTCDMRTWPKVSAAVMLRNEQRFPGVLSADAFFLSLEAGRTAPGDMTGQSWSLLPSAVSPLSLTDQPATVVRRFDTAYLTFDPNASAIVELAAEVPGDTPRPVIGPSDVLRCTVRIDPLRLFSNGHPDRLSTSSFSVILP
ncbi:hypothetical protein [Maritimibacter sp. DP1N21-5]|uniref:hypothetical protein n=1 Tax=Maritimibacter sp. DP1N21-5 TaxID=2836867 RepID=UPI001C46B573|nr:hypothetical protein [Maritimibacter sp. DP1N21-5]MBV7410462.1 hypothetical protein [Maritimibacter sp. DP1N21-5]